MSSSSSSFQNAFDETIQQSKLVRYELFACCLVLSPLMILTTTDAELQKNTFGEDRFYFISGLLNTFGGIVSVICGVVLGSMSDFMGRNQLLSLCMVMLAIPPLLAAITEDYWIFYVSRACLMFNGAAFSIIMASIVDKTRRSADEEEKQVQENNDDEDMEEKTKKPSTETQNNKVEVLEIEQQQNSPSTTPSSSPSSSNGKTETTKKRTSTFTITMLTFIVSLLVGSSLGTSIPDLRYKFYAQLLLDAFAILWILFIGIKSAKPPVMEQVLGNDKQTHQTREQKQGPEDGETPTITTTTNTSTNAANTTTTSQQKIRHAHNTKEKILKLFRNKNLVIMFLVVFFDMLAEEVMQTSMLLYAQNTLHFSSVEQQVLLGAFGLSSMFSLLVVSRIFAEKFSIVDSLRISICAHIFGCVSFGLASEKWMLFLAGTSASVGILSFPLVNSISSLIAADEDAGSSLGFITAARFLAQGISPSIFGLFFQAVKNTSFPGLPFVVASIGPMIAIVLASSLPKDIGEKKQK